MTPPWMKLFFTVVTLFFFITCAQSKRHWSSRLSSFPVFSLFLSLALCVVRGLNQLPCCAALLPPPPPLSVSLFRFPSSALALGRRRRRCWLRQLLYKLPDPALLRSRCQKTLLAITTIVIHQLPNLFC